jgi:hypothetical protein
VLSLAGVFCFQSTLPAPEKVKKIKVTVVTILASTQCAKVNKQLKCIAEEVRKKNPAFKGFELWSMECKSLAVDEKWTCKLVDGQEAQIVIHKGADKDNQVELKIKAPLQGDIVYGTVCGKFLPIITRYQTKKKQERLIIAIMVKPCNKNKNKNKK